MNIWLFCATAPLQSFATISAINSLIEGSGNQHIKMCLSVQSDFDANVLSGAFPGADVFEPDTVLKSELSEHPRRRSVIHSTILNQGWSRRQEADYYIIMDNDVIFPKSFELQKAIDCMVSDNAVLLGSEYPGVHPLRVKFRNQKPKPRNLPNCIFCIMESSFYKDEDKLCEFDAYALAEADPYYKEDAVTELRGCQIDTGAKIYQKPLLQNKPYIVLNCHNRWHPYYPGRVIDFFFGSDISPEFYRHPQLGVVVHHFKKLSIIASKDSAQKDYAGWVNKVHK